MCVVFAETEIVGLLAQGATAEDIAAGIQASIAQRINTMEDSRQLLRWSPFRVMKPNSFGNAKSGMQRRNVKRRNRNGAWHPASQFVDRMESLYTAENRTVRSKTAKAGDISLNQSPAFLAVKDIMHLLRIALIRILSFSPSTRTSAELF